MVASLAQAAKVFDALVLGLASLTAGKLANRGVTCGQNHPAGLHPQGFWGGYNCVMVGDGSVDMVPAGFLAVIAPEGFEPFTSKGDGTVTGNHRQRSQATQPPLLEMLGLSGVEGILLTDAVEVSAVVGAVDGASFRAAAIAAGLSHGEK